MIPLTDESRRPASFPVITAAIIAVNVLVFVLELAGGDAFVTRWSAVPADIVADHVLPDRDVALRFLLQGARWPRSVLFRLIFPKICEAMMQFMNINAATAREAEEQLVAAIERLDEALSGRRFLVEDSQSIAHSCAQVRASSAETLCPEMPARSAVNQSCCYAHV